MRCIENRAQAGPDFLGFLLRLFRSRLAIAQSLPKRQHGCASSLAPNCAQRYSDLGLEGLVVRVEDAREVSVGAVGGGVLKNERAALAPRHNRKGDLAGRTMGQRMGNGHFDALVSR